MFGTLRFKATFPWSDTTQVWRCSLTSCVLCSSVSSSDLRSWLWLSSDCSVCTRSVRAAMFRFPSDEDALSPSTRSWKTQDITQSFLLNSLSLSGHQSLCAHLQLSAFALSLSQRLLQRSETPLGGAVGGSDFLQALGESERSLFLNALSVLSFGQQYSQSVHLPLKRRDARFALCRLKRASER